MGAPARPPPCRLSAPLLLPHCHRQGEAIAVNLREMFGFRVPIISVVIGEGGSGGALAIGARGGGGGGAADAGAVAARRCCGSKAMPTLVWAQRCGASNQGRALRTPLRGRHIPTPNSCPLSC